MPGLLAEAGPMACPGSARFGVDIVDKFVCECVCVYVFSKGWCCGLTMFLATAF